MAEAIRLGGTFLHEMLAFGVTETSGLPTVRDLALGIVDSWRRAVSGGVAELFPRRLAAEGLSEEEILARLQRGLCYWAEKTPRWLLWLQRVVPEGAMAGQVPRLLAGAFGHACHRRFAVPLFSRKVPEALVQQLERQLCDLLAHADAPTSARAWDLFADRPILARLLATRTCQWLRSCRRLARRVQRDHPNLSECLLDGESLQVTEVTFGLSDRHEGGETVARLTNRGGAAFYYKPRSLHPERVLSGFFEALRSAGLQLPSLPKMLLRGGYGWVLEVPRANLTSRQDVQRWFFAAGHLAVGAWLLGLSDAHWENVVAGNEGPVVVDGEAWCRPLTVFDGNQEAGILSSGLVTFPANGPSGLRDDGALLGGIRPEARSLPLLAGQPVNPCKYRESILAGARDALETLLCARRSGLLRLPFAELSRLQVRWVGRPSEVYASFLSSALRNPRVRQCWQVSVLAETRWRAPLAAGMDWRALLPFFRAETKALHAFALPRFTLPATRRGGVVLRSGKEQVLHRLSQLNGSFIERQLTVLAAAIPRSVAKPGAWLLDATSQVAAVLREEEAALDAESGPFLRRGSAGRAVAWAAWAKVSGDEKARRLALRHLDQVLNLLEREGFRQWLPGFGSGLGGVVYALACCGRWLEIPKLEQLASEVAGEALGGFTVGDHLDVEAGLAGLLLGVAAVSKGESLPLLERLAHELAGAAAQAKPADGGGSILNPGFAHGVSGVAAALLQVAHVTGNRRWAQEAVRLFQREPRAGSWLVEAHVRTGEHLAVSFNGWCHGPAGALVARELVPAELRTSQIVHHIQEAYARVIPLKLASPLSLCCGSIARSEISLILGELAGCERFMDEARKLAGMLFRSGLWRQELNPKGGLLDGLPGLLFHLSRLLKPERVGSVLVGGVEGGSPWR